LNEDPREDELQYKNLQAYNKKMQQNLISQKKTFDSLNAALKRSGFTILPPSVVDLYMQADQEYKINSVDIIVTTVDSVQLLYNSIRNNKSLIGSIETAAAKNELSYYKNLYKKLIEKANTKATMIALSGNLKLGTIFSVIENKPEDAPGGWTAYPPLSALSNNVVPGWHTTIKGRAAYILSGKSIEAGYIISNSLTVRFSAD
ncbi:MAG: hypothetical protein ABI921_09435, partial [Panacibacter sp.]